jgi:hypothetical protein
MKCRICNSEDITDILSLGNQYLSEFRNDNKKPLRFPLDLVICNKCYQVQLRDTVPSNLLYSDNYGYRSGINFTMKKHLKLLVEEAINIIDTDKGFVVDIGSNDGTLLKSYPNWFHRTGFDLVPKFGKDYTSHQIEFRNEPFTASSYNRKAKIITAISMFYDLDNPVALMKDMAQCLDKKGIIVIQQNYLLSMLQNNAFDNICHEHLCYHSLSSIITIANKCNLDIFDVELNELNGGSIRTYLCHKDDYEISDRVPKQMELEETYRINNLNTYMRFANRVEYFANQLYIFIKAQVNEGKIVYLYGASTRGNTLLQYCRLDNTLIKKAVERNPEKYGKRIASVGIPIIPEEQMRYEKPDALLVLPWHFKDEFVKREEQYLKDGGKLIFPLPRFEVISE